MEFESVVCVCYYDVFLVWLDVVVVNFLCEVVVVEMVNLEGFFV